MYQALRGTSVASALGLGLEALLLKPVSSVGSPWVHGACDFSLGASLSCLGSVQACTLLW